MRFRLTLTLALVLPIVASSVAQAQYKNSAFGLDVGYWFLTKPSIVDPSTQQPYTARDQLPLRLQGGFRIGGESNFKMDEDHFWFTARVNVGFLQYPSGSAGSTSLDEQFDYNASKTLGTMMGIEGQIGVRYVFLTDRFRPYLQGALSYMRLMSFSSASSDA